MFLHVYREKPEDEIMVEEVKFNNNSVNNTTVAQSTDTKSATVSTSSVKTNTIFEEFKKYAKKMGIELSDDELIQFFNSNPNFQTLSLEGQTTAFNKFLSEKNNVVTNNSELDEVLQEPKIVGTSVQNTEVSAANSEFSVVSQPNIFVSSDTQVQTGGTVSGEEVLVSDADISIEDEVVLSEDNVSAMDYKIEIGGDDYDSAAFSLKTNEEMEKEYIYEYAKNKYTYTDAGGNVGLWNVLSDDERAKIIEKYKPEAQKKVDNAYKDKQIVEQKKIDNAKNGQQTKYPKSNTDVFKVVMQQNMSELQVANQNGIALERYISETSAMQKKTDIAWMLECKEKNTPEKLSEEEKIYLEKANQQRDIVRYQLIKDGKIQADDKISMKQVYDYIDPNNKEYRVNIAEAKRDMLLEKQKAGKTLSPIEKETLDFLNSMPDELLKKYGSETGPTDLEKELLINENYRNASYLEKKEIMSKHVQERCANDPTQIEKYLVDATLHGNESEIKSLFKIAKQAEFAGARKAIATTKEQDLVVVVSTTEDGMSAVGEYATNLVENIENSKDFSIAEKSKLHTGISEKSSAEQYGMITSNKEVISTLNTDTQSIYSTGYQIRNKNGEFSNEEALAITQNIHSNDAFTQKAKDANGLHLHELNKEIQNDAVKCVNAKTADAMAHSGNIHLFEDQSGVGAIIKQKVETGLPKDLAIAAEKAIADEIHLFRKEHQLAMHRTISNSKYSEVVEHAAANIYTYDRTVQSEAVKISYEVAAKTGNIKIIENIGRNYTKLDPEVQQVIANDQVMAKALSEITARAIGEDNELTALIKNESAAGLGLPKTEKEVFLEKWNEMSSAEKYQFMCEISTKYFNKMSPDMKKRVLEHAKNDPLLMRRLVKAYGLDLLKTQLFPDALGVIVRELLQDPAERMSVAREVCNQPSRYSESLVEKCQELLAEHNNIKMEAFNQLSGMEKREVLKNSSEYASAPFGGQMGANRSNLIDLEDPNEFKTQANLRSIHFLG